MKTTSAFIILFYSISIFSAYAQKKASELPAGWTLTGSSKEYIAGTITDSILNKKVAYLKSTNDKYLNSDFGTIMQWFNATKYLGKRIRFSAMVKTSGVEHWAGLWLRVDNEDGRSTNFDNMENRSIIGTNNWKRYEIVLDVPINSRYLN
jgi:hypothetical protein